MQDFFKSLKNNGYAGDAHDDHAMRTLMATDNSIYQVVPQAILFPRSGHDLDVIFKTANQDDFKHLKFAPRGGGTGTNGQSLNQVITVDTSKYMTDILEVNIAERYVRVQPGVVLTVLNAMLAEDGFFFPAHVSTANRATMGGMVSTDACGKGSVIYGKTGDYVQSIDAVLADGQTVTLTPDMKTEFESSIKSLLKDNREVIVAATPDLPRHFTGYNLKDAYNPDTGSVNLMKMIAGSEGSLLMIKEITLGIVPREKYASLFAISYPDFIGALKDVSDILSFGPSAVETMDNNVLRIARNDNIWEQVTRIIPDDADVEKINAMHCVEFTAASASELKQKSDKFEARLKGGGFIYHYTDEPAEMDAVWQMRNQCVGLLGNMEGPRRPWPFVEDAAVPPEHLPDYVADVRTFLKSQGYECGMFGHVDAGCLHIRPILDLRDEKDAEMIRPITEGMVKLVAKYKGNFWGEHGRGLRGEFIRDIMGNDFYQVMREIKKIFDPDNRLNPGKMVTAAGSDVDLIKVDEMPYRGTYDRQIQKAYIDAYPKAIQCNGNGVCFSAMPTDTMCPSYKATRDRRHSPKGRAGLLREWMRLKSIGQNDDFDREVYDAMAGCLGCKACTNTCPIHVNIPDMKAEFLNDYHAAHKRPLRDYLVARTENMAEQLAAFPELANLLIKMPLTKLILKQIFKMTDVPVPSSPTLKSEMKKYGFKFYADGLQGIDVLVVQDAFTSFYDVPAMVACLQLLRRCGFEPAVLPFHESGKSWHVKGFMDKFEHIAKRNTAYYSEVAKSGLPMIGIDPSVTIVYRDEYPKILKRDPGFKVYLLQEWLFEKLERPLSDIKGDTIQIFSHCSEKTTLPRSYKWWEKVFAHFGVKTIHASTGCCGMAGTYGHETEHQENSKKLFDLSWRKKLNPNSCVSGYSCRSQIKRFMPEQATRHPAQELIALIDGK